jgi:cell division septum initiation protein DivIVA
VDFQQAFLKTFVFKLQAATPIRPMYAHAGCPTRRRTTAMRRNEKSWEELDELLEPFLPEEHIETAAATSVEFRNRLVKLEQQVLSQYTAMAAYATIAKQDTDHVRAEARADLDRSQSTVIGLIEKLRNEMNLRLDRLELRIGASDMTADGATRLSGVEQHLAAMASALEQCIRENQELRAQVASLVEHRMNEQGWLVSAGSTEALSLR